MSDKVWDDACAEARGASLVRTFIHENPVTDVEKDMIREAREDRDEIKRLRAVLAAVDHTLTAHGHMDANTPLHERITEALKIT